MDRAERAAIDRRIERAGKRSVARTCVTRTDVSAESPESCQSCAGPCGDGIGGSAGARIHYVRFVCGIAADDHAALASAICAETGWPVELPAHCRSETCLALCR